MSSTQISQATLSYSHEKKKRSRRRQRPPHPRCGETTRSSPLLCGRASAERTLRAWTESLATRNDFKKELLNQWSNKQPFSSLQAPTQTASMIVMCLLIRHMFCPQRNLHIIKLVWNSTQMLEHWICCNLLASLKRVTAVGT